MAEKKIRRTAFDVVYEPGYDWANDPAKWRICKRLQIEGREQDFRIRQGYWKRQVNPDTQKNYTLDEAFRKALLEFAPIV